MCLLKACKYIEIIDGLPTPEKMYIHYDADHKPLWIDYMDMKLVRQPKRRTLRKIQQKTRKLSHRATTLLPADGTW
jgi:hypothetical protein